MSEPVADITIAVHSATRPIARAVSSVLDHTQTDVRVNVVAHNIDSEVIRANLGVYADDPRVRLLEFTDGIPSPAGPMNHGLDSSTGQFVGLLGSDDEFAPGAIDSWVRVLREWNADVVLAKIRLATGLVDPYPPVRWSARSRLLDPVKDRLSYRSAPLGLVRNERFGGLRLAEGLPSGEDLAYSLTLWFTADRIVYDLDGPAYVIHPDATDRVTYAPRPIDQDFAFLDAIAALPWFSSAAPRIRIAVTAKLVRIHLFDAIAARTLTQSDLESNRGDLVELIGRFEQMAPGVTRLLSRADRNVIDLLHGPDPSVDQIQDAVGARHNYLAFSTLFPRELRFSLHRQAPFRTLFAGYRIQRESK